MQFYDWIWRIFDDIAIDDDVKKTENAGVAVLSYEI